MQRRDLLRAAFGGIVSVAGATAGCQQEPREDCPRVPTEPNYRGWFDGVSNYDGTCDRRDRDAVTVAVGVQGDIGYFKFGPPAVAVSPGTAVTWEWTGRGGAHNVVADRGPFSSGTPVDREGETYSRTFDAPAVYRYYCDPHRTSGMRGAVFVTLEEASV